MTPNPPGWGEARRIPGGTVSLQGRAQSSLLGHTDPWGSDPVVCDTDPAGQHGCHGGSRCPWCPRHIRLCIRLHWVSPPLDVTSTGCHLHECHLHWVPWWQAVPMMSQAHQALYFQCHLLWVSPPLGVTSTGCHLPWVSARGVPGTPGSVFPVSPLCL